MPRQALYLTRRNTATLDIGAQASLWYVDPESWPELQLGSFLNIITDPLLVFLGASMLI